ncbi:MAG: hypothetical protein EKK64_02445 [Neisseriaceae bacterium]|nr:MAG: hypothetical protein EKK64_02445 [Neisseriaceae bacterium]
MKLLNKDVLPVIDMCTTCNNNNSPVPSPQGEQGPIGPQGVQGDPGINGVNGISIGYTVVALNIGDPNCPCSGHRIDFGQDTDNNGINNNTTSSIYVCNGCAGSSGYVGINPILMVYDDPNDVSKFETTDPLTKGLGKGIYSGWAICNGLNSTPDLRGRVPLAYADNDVTFSTVGSSAGSKTNTLLPSNIPLHKHTINTTLTDTGSISVSGGNHIIPLVIGDSFIGSPSLAWLNDPILGRGFNNDDVYNQNTHLTSLSYDTTHSHTIIGDTGDGSSQGLGSNPINNMQPYYVLLFIKKI